MRFEPNHKYNFRKTNTFGFKKLKLVQSIIYLSVYLCKLSQNKSNCCYKSPVERYMFITPELHVRAPQPVRPQNKLRAL